MDHRVLNLGQPDEVNISSTDGNANPQLNADYIVTFTTSQLDTTPPKIIKVEVKPSPTMGAVLFQFDKPMNKAEAENISR